MEIFSLSTALTRVDLPTFGSPIIAAKPHLVSPLFSFARVITESCIAKKLIVQ
jgi:hypothetical protein